MVAYFEKYQLFKIDTLNTTYAFKVVHDKYVSHNLGRREPFGRERV